MIGPCKPLRLPLAYRAYLLVCGDVGPGFPDGGFKKPTARKRMEQPFPLDAPWIEYDQGILDDAANNSTFDLAGMATQG